MAQIEQIVIKCANCQTVFRSPIAFGDSTAFETATLQGNEVQCPRCHRFVGLDKAHMKWRAVDGSMGFRGDDFDYNWG